MQHYPRHVRKTIITFITVAVAIVLAVLMIVVYSNRHDSSQRNESTSKINDFYTTILSKGQSSIGSK